LRSGVKTQSRINEDKPLLVSLLERAAQV